VLFDEVGGSFGEQFGVIFEDLGDFGGHRAVEEDHQVRYLVFEEKFVDVI